MIALVGINVAFLIPQIRSKAIHLVGRKIGVSGTADSLRYTPWSGVNISNFKVGDGTLIHAQSVSFDLKETQLLSRTLEVDDVSVEGGVFTFLYRPPKAPPTVVASVPQKSAAAAVPDVAPTPPVAAQEKTPEQKPVPQVKTKAPKRWSTKLGSIEVEDIRFVVTDESEENEILSAENFSFISPAEGDGEISLGSLLVNGHQAVSDIKGTLRRGQEETFNVTSLTGDVLGATLSGSLELAPRRPTIPFATDLVIKALTHPEISGSVDAELKLQGGVLSPYSWHGQALALAPGTLSLTKFPSTEFIQTQLQGVIQSGTFLIADARAIASNSGSLSLRASGQATMTGDVAFNVRPYILADALPVAQKLLTPFFGGQPPKFALLPPSPLVFTEFAIRGKATDPQLYFSNEQPPIALLDFINDFENPSAEN